VADAQDRFKFTTIAHHGRALLGPLSADTVDALLARIAPAPAPGARAAVLDVGCGKGEILLRAMRRFAATGVGVDSNPTFIAEARARGRGMVAVSDLALFGLPFALAPVPRGRFDLVICTGATHAFADHAFEIAPLARPGGWAMIGVGYWRQPPAAEYLASFGGREDEMLPLPATLAASARAGWRLVAHQESTLDEWDDYEHGYEDAVRRWLAARPDDPDAPAFRERIDAWSAGYQRWGRDTMGFVTMVLKR
jgi:SAM-dependent methyltransferase